MTTDQVNYLNIGLMGISLVAAFILPFEVFLFSYAILGPLHYLTEISWLHDRKYFTPGKLDWIPLLAFSFLILLGGGAGIMGDGVAGFFDGLGLGGVMNFLREWSYDITFFAFGMALLFILTKNAGLRIGGLVLLLAAAFFFHQPTPDATLPGHLAAKRWQEKLYSPYWAIFAVYLPTLIHVYLFTGAFIIFGALKRSSRSGYLSFAFFLFCAVACFIFLTDPSYYQAGSWAKDSYYGTFESLSQSLLAHFGGYEFGTVTGDAIFTNPMSIMFARFIAFAYTYHYLNWFSKTSLIRWHKVPKLRFLAVIGLWVASIALYLYSYKIGFRWLFLLSFAHVLLEFPLNHQSFIGIGQEVWGRISGSKKAAA